MIETPESTPRISRNDYSVLTPPEIGSWTPRLRVSVVIPAYGGQDKLDLVLAALSVQTYPPELTEVVVVDNGSSPPLRLPDLRPAGTRLITCETPGRAEARNAGLAATGGDVVHWLDSDVVLERDAVEAQMRWHHLAPYLSVTGYLRFTTAPPPRPADIADADGLAPIFEPAEPHAWIVDLVGRTDGLRDAHRAFSLHVGGSTSVNRRLIETAGPMDTGLMLGQDTEMGYRLAQAGAVFIPEPRSRAYHLGPTMRMRDMDSVSRVSHAFITDRVAQYRWLRSHPARQWLVPYVEVVVDGAGASYEDVRATVDTVLAGTVPDVGVVVTGVPEPETRERRAPLTDPCLDRTLVRGHYAHEARVRFTEPGAPAPFRLRVPAGWALGEDTLATLIDTMEERGLGLVGLLLSEDGPGHDGEDREDGEDAGGDVHGGRGEVTVARLERSAAYNRAAFVREPVAGEPGPAVGSRPGGGGPEGARPAETVAEPEGRARQAAQVSEALDDAVAEMYGAVWIDGRSVGLLPAGEAPAVRGRRSAYRARVEAEAEAAKLAKEVERLRGQVGKWRDEAAKWRKSAVDLRREVGSLRKEVGSLRRNRKRSIKAIVRRVIYR
ncbi:glycosyltransferase family 2 protein [Microtetraspora niveoalba]|uniref:glycosyltransferase family 2 protein n=1 Tax=Microtetraspora niveoalba TaxID=46175 RepID=UPI000A755CC8|nr:glycosyltransferase family 2 protein [Microtetraspora niveoalba]